MIYTMGYGTPGSMATLDKFIAEGGLLWDIRFSPSSMNPTWRKDALVARFGPAYRHVRALGNKNYKSGPIELVDFDAGVKLLSPLSSSVVLMCVCKDASQCHRTVVANRLIALGYSVSEIEYVPVEPKIKKGQAPVNADAVQQTLLEF